MQCCCFAILFPIWNIPHTNFLTDTCLIIGALLSIYLLNINRGFFRSREALPLWLTLLLFTWVLFHLLFLFNNYELQERELYSIWKRVILAFIFAIGFGISISQSLSKKRDWIIIYASLCGPTFIYLIKLTLSIIAENSNILLPEYLRIFSYRSSVYYINKTDIVSFSLPLLAVIFGTVHINLSKNKEIDKKSKIIYLISLFSVLFIYYINNIKNGFAYTIILLVTLTFILIKKKLVKFRKKNVNYIRLIINLHVLLILLFLLISHVQKNESWKYIIADSKVAIQVDHNDSWKFWQTDNYPLNEYGVKVSPSNYERISWGIVGLRLMAEYPLGYGLVERSFSYISKTKWPESSLDQSHSGWIDLALGIGIPGCILTLITLFLIIGNLIKNQGYSTEWSIKVCWILYSLSLMWLTSEVSLKIHLICLFFWIGFGMGLSWQKDYKKAMDNKICL